jgi:hypothetical protein
VGLTLTLAHPLYYDRLVQLASTIFGTIILHGGPTSHCSATDDLADCTIRLVVGVVSRKCFLSFLEAFFLVLDGIDGEDCGAMVWFECESLLLGGKRRRDVAVCVAVET